MFDLKIAVEAAALSCLFILEHYIPFISVSENRWSHAARNLGVGFLNFLMTAVLFSGAVYLSASWTARRGAGLLNLLDVPDAVRWGSALLLLDLWMYAWHWINHNLPWLWRFHRMHHTDRSMDVTTAVRFHPGEIALSTAAKLAVIPLLGLEIKHLLIYETLIQPVILFHHSNVRVSERWDRLLRAVIVTPRMHRTHHSDVIEETNSNYSTVLSIWDRAARTFRLRAEPETIRYGVREFSGGAWQSFFGMLRTPFAGVRP